MCSWIFFPSSPFSVTKTNKPKTSTSRSWSRALLVSRTWELEHVGERNNSKFTWHTPLLSFENFYPMNMMYQTYIMCWLIVQSPQSWDINQDLSELPMRLLCIWLRVFNFLWVISSIKRAQVISSTHKHDFEKYLFSSDCYRYSFVFKHIGRIRTVGRRILFNWSVGNPREDNVRPQPSLRMKLQKTGNTYAQDNGEERVHGC